jgi:hypothetical protein
VPYLMAAVIISGQGLNIALYFTKKMFYIYTGDLI